MSTYEPAPGLHDRPVAVKHPGYDTHPFAAVRPYAPQNACVPETCRCDEHKYGHRPGTDAVLYAGPDAMALVERAAIRDGRYEDALAYADHIAAELHAKCEAAAFSTRRTLEPAWEPIDAWRRGRAA